LGLARAAVAAVWVFCVASFFVPATSDALAWGRRLFWLLLAAHVAEFLVFFRVLRSAPGGLARHLLHTLIFGIFYIREVRGPASPPASGP